jgi:galactonate dehydratase
MRDPGDRHALASDARQSAPPEIRVMTIITQSSAASCSHDVMACRNAELWRLPMKITKIETIRLKSRATIIWVRVHTNAGIVGLGESWFGCAAIEADIHDRIAPLLIGQDTSRIEVLNRQMRPYVGFTGTSAEVRATSAVDVALWDIAGKAANLPIYALLGGATRDSIRVYNTCAGPSYISQSSDVKPGNFGLPADRGSNRYEDLQGFMTRADDVAGELLEMGISSMKIWPFDFAEGAVDGVDISTEDLKIAMKPFEKVRAKHGDKMRLKAELHGIWSLTAAKKICAALEDIQPDWIEDPIWMDRISDIAELTDSTRAPLAGGETLGALGQLRELMQIGRIGTPIIDVTWGGGITFAKKVAALAESFGKPVAFHDCSGPVTLAVSTQLAMVCPNVAEQEMTRAFYYDWYGECVDQLPPVEKGRIRPAEGSGHGLTLDPGVLKRADAIIRVSDH